MSTNFTHLHVHSQYSLLDGQASIKGLVDNAVAMGMKGIALTDHGDMFGIKEFYNYVKQINADRPEDDKFKPILGCEMYVVPDMKDKASKNERRNHLIVLAKNQTGYHNLIKLVSKAWTDGFYYRPRTDWKELEQHHEGLIICSACIAGEIPQLILSGDMKRAEERMLWFKNIFGEDYYIELQRHKTDKPNANMETYPLQQEANKGLVELARKHGVKMVVTNDVHFTTEADADAHDCLICVSTQKNYDDTDRMHYTKQEWLKSPEQMESIFPDFPDAIANTMEVLDKVEFYSIDHAPIMPNFKIPADFGTEEEYRNRITEQELFDEFTRDENGNVVLSKEDADKKISRLGGYDKLYRIKFEADYLKKLTMEGAAKRYPMPLSEEVSERIKFELHIMKTMGFPGYFLIVQDFINAARDKLGVSVGPGRGSAAGSVVAYCLRITDVDPLKYDLLFERFLNPDRISLPDIDVDFDDDGRYTVLNYVTDKYGADKVAHIITYTTMATKSVIRDVARVMQLPLPESIRLTKLVPDRLPEVNGKAPKINLENCFKYVPEFKTELNSPDPKVGKVLDFARRLEGNVRNTGIHACGVIIGRDPITDWVPVSTAKDTDGKDVIVTQYEGSVIEDTGMIKMDFLGLKTLSIIKEALTNIKLHRGIDLDIDHIPLDDEATLNLYCKGATTATFQFESPGMQSSLRELQPSKFEDLIAMNALYRPGPMAYIPQFIARKHGKEPIVYDIPVMEKYLSETYGITVYQEQVMLLSRLLASFTRGESDKLRKAMGKKKLAEMAKLKVKFMKQGQENGHNADVLEKIWADWTEFAKYAFNKSHATCYSWVAYQTAYLKANYPAEYMAGVLSRNLGVPDKLTKYMDECRVMKIPVKGPDVNESLDKFNVTEDGSIRFGLGAIKGFGSNAVTTILTERERNGKFKDIYDFVERVNLSACNRSAIESLAFSGAFDSFGLDREVYVAEVGNTTFSDVLVKYGQRFQNDRDSIQFSLFSDLEPIETSKPQPPSYEKWSKLRLLEEEKKMVTRYLSAHPLDRYYMELTYGCNTRCNEINELFEDGKHITFGGLVTDFIIKTSAKGTPYGVLKLEDFQGSCEIRLFSKNFEMFQKYGIKGTAIRISAVVEESRYRPGNYDLRFAKVEYLDDLVGKIANQLEININTDEPVKEIASIFELSSDEDNMQRPGNLVLNMIMPQSGQRLRMRSKKFVDINRELVNSLKDININYNVVDA